MFGRFLTPQKIKIPDPETCLPGREVPLAVAKTHTVLGSSTVGPWPDMEVLIVGLGCFWGAERAFWTLDGVVSTQVGYSAGTTPNPTYQEVCSGRTGHNEVVRVVFDPTLVSLEDILRRFWESHDPTQGMRQGNDVGTQYRSGVYCVSDTQLTAAELSRDAFQRALTEAGFGTITTEVLRAGPFYFAEDYHQQYLDKNPGGYCGLGGTGVSCPVSPLSKE